MRTFSPAMMIAVLACTAESYAQDYDGVDAERGPGP